MYPWAVCCYNTIWSPIGDLVESDYCQNIPSLQFLAFPDRPPSLTSNMIYRQSVFDSISAVKGFNLGSILGNYSRCISTKPVF